jgi:4-amino-4-deoxy-L-arabinose transferase-like glycosyltransferase
MATTSAPSPGQASGEIRIPVPAWADRTIDRLARVPEWVWIAAFLIVVCAASVYLRTGYISGQFWMDEAITVGVSSHSLTAIPGVLRMDGAPPLFYLLLHIWMSWFGDSEAATHSLALLFGTLTVPVSYWGAHLMFGKRAAVYAAVLFATNVFISIYSEETRMYSLMALLGLIATIGYLQGFVFRRRKFVILFAVAQGLMLYTHAWAVFYGAGSFIALVVLWRQGDDAFRTNLVRDGLFAYCGAAVIFLPWLPNFIFQTTHTAAPWDSSPRFGVPVQISRNILGGDRVTAAIVISAAIGLAPLFTKRGRGTPESKAMWMLIAIPVLTLALAWIASQITPAWVGRYFAPIVAPMLLLAALGMSRARLVGAVGLLLMLVFVAFPAAYAPQYKSDMKDVGAEMAGLLHPGNLVIVAQPEQTPLADYYLPGGLKYANPANRTVLRDPTFMNWVDALKRIEHIRPATVVPRLLASVPVGGQVLLISPLTEGAGNWTAPWTKMVRRRSAQWSAIIAADKQFVPVAWAPHSYRGACCVADSAVLYKKVS